MLEVESSFYMFSTSIENSSFLLTRHISVYLLFLTQGSFFVYIAARQTWHEQVYFSFNQNFHLYPIIQATIHSINDTT